MATINGTPGNDTIVGTPRADTINARQGNDSASGAGANDRVFGQSGNDNVNGDAGDDYVNGGPGGDAGEGGIGNDRVQGGPENDALNGNTGNDVLFGDTLSASDVGSDQFTFNTNEGSDRILDFVNSAGSTAGENDLIVIQDATTAELEATFGPNGAIDDADQGVSIVNGDLLINFAQVQDTTNTYGNGALRIEMPFVSNFPDGLLIGTDIVGGEPPDSMV